MAYQLLPVDQQTKIDLERIKKFFPKNFIDNLSKCYEDYILQGKVEFRDPESKQFFTLPGHHLGRNDSAINKEVSNYLNRLLYSPNIAIIDYVLKNYNTMKKLKFADNGCGSGLLSVFLKYIGIECFNYDDLTQISNTNLHKLVKKQLNLDILPVTSDTKKLRDFKPNVVTSAGIWITSPSFKNDNLKFALIDRYYIDKPHNIHGEITQNLTEVEEYGIELKIFTNHLI